MNKPPHIITTLPELRAAHPEAWAYLHIIHKTNGRLDTYGIDLDTFQWNGQVDDVLEDDTNATLPPPSEEEIMLFPHLAEAALEYLLHNETTITFEDYGEQAFSQNLLPNRVLYEATLSFEYEHEEA